MYFRMFLWSIKCYTLCHQKMLKSALKKQKNATVVDAIIVICCSKSPPVYRGKMEEKRCLCSSKSGTWVGGKRGDVCSQEAYVNL